MSVSNPQYEAMRAAALSRLAARDPSQIARHTGLACQNGAFSFTTLGRAVTVRLPDYAISPPLSMWHTLTLLHALDLADGAQPTGAFLPLSSYPDGLSRGVNFDRDVEQRLRRLSASLSPESLTARSLALGGQLLPSNADFCAKFSFLPVLPLWLKVWFADEDFPASARIFLDASAPHILPIEDAVTLATLLLDAVFPLPTSSSES